MPGCDAVDLAPGDPLLLYTDGVTEAKNPQKEEFGQERLVELVRQGSNRSVQALVREVRNRLEAFTDGQPLADDTTIVVGKV